MPCRVRRRIASALAGRRDRDPLCISNGHHQPTFEKEKDTHTPDKNAHPSQTDGQTEKDTNKTNTVHPHTAYSIVVKELKSLPYGTLCVCVWKRNDTDTNKTNDGGW